MNVFVVKNRRSLNMVNAIKNQLSLHINQFRKSFVNLSFEEKENVCKTLKKTGIEINLYENPTPIAVAIVKVMTTQGLKFLTVVRGLSPCVGEYCLPGGYVDKMENAQMAAARELFEETGLDLIVSNFRLIDSKISNRNTMLIFCEYIHTLQEQDIDWTFKSEETLRLSLGDKNTQYCFKTHQEIIEAYDI